MKRDKQHFRAKCLRADKGCNWIFFASTSKKSVGCKVKRNGPLHMCGSVNNCGDTMVTQNWVAERVVDMLKENPTKGPHELQAELKKKFSIEIPYYNDESYVLVPTYRAALLNSLPGSIVELDTEEHHGDMCFRRFFVALKPCIDGFLQGCRPYVAIDATHLTGRSRGQLAAAVAIDGQNLLFLVAYGVIESETTERWTWFIEKLKVSIGTPIGLVISTDAGKDIGATVDVVYPGVEHRECMRHLWKNFKMHYYGTLFDYNMWPAAKSYTIEKFNWHMDRIKEKSKFSSHCKVDYINNNLSESFNNCVHKLKDLNIVDMHEKIRQMIIKKFELRRKIAMSMEGRIIPSITKALIAQSKAIKDCEVLRCANGTAKIYAPTKSGALFRHAVNLENKTCSCRAWHVIGKPCRHALVFIAKLSREVQMDDYVHDYFFVEKFNPMTSKHFWPRVDLEYKIKKPILRRKPGRPRISRIKGSDETRVRKKKRCPECGELGHTSKKCQGVLIQVRLEEEDHQHGGVHVLAGEGEGEGEGEEDEEFQGWLSISMLRIQIAPPNSSPNPTSNPDL
ncbi:hypothetical protein U9M48_030548 [Paspalum notatum var. saurae]|uniref:SWIM-type domain-containing protein n=1 Tax=Paspalum notatum var. saurae TaxID=547442 RepID=A0AAQ3U531_PASNO